jgi:hypothetical protein
MSQWSERSQKQKQKQKKTPWSESASELYRPSDRRLSANWLPHYMKWDTTHDATIASRTSSDGTLLLFIYLLLPYLVHWLLPTIFVRNSDNLTGGWGKLHSEELHNLYSSPIMIIMIKSRRMRWSGHVARTEKQNACRLIVGESDRKRPLGWPWRRCVAIKMNLRYRMRWYGLD